MFLFFIFAYIKIMNDTCDLITKFNDYDLPFRHTYSVFARPYDKIIVKLIN